MTDEVKKQPGIVWGYSESLDAERWCGRCATREEAIEEARKEYGRDAVFYVILGRADPPSAFMPSVDYILEAVAESAYDEAGEAADDFPDVSDEDRESLKNLLASWANEHLTVSFWVCDGKPERIEPEKPT